MTTIWRPHVRRKIPNIDDAKGEVEVPEEVNKGVKRKRAPPTKGPCEHGVKPRSRCKVCSACPHGRRRSQCKECGGSGICEHGRRRSECKECGGSQICEHGRERSSARSAVGHQSASTVVSALSARSAVGHQSASTVVSALVQGVRWVRNLRARSSALSVQGVRWVCNLRARSSSAHQCKECGGSQYASTVVIALVQGVQEVANVSSIKRTSSKPRTRRHHAGHLLARLLKTILF